MIPSLFLRMKAVAVLGLLTMALPGIGRGQATIDPPQKYTVTPNPAGAGKVFTLSLNGGTFPCGTVFSRQSVIVSANRIDLSFEADSPVMIQRDPGAIPPVCLDDMANLPTFSMPALKAGAYEVWATQVYACQFTQPACMIKVAPQYAGTLTVSDSAPRTGWFLKDHEVAANLAFPMQLLNNAYGNCQTTFTHVTQTVNGMSIAVSFAVETDNQRVCIVDLRPYGPTVDMPALKAGAYPVYVSSLPPCLFANPACEIGILPVLFPSDTLIVSKTAAVLMSALRAGGLTASFQGARVEFDLPRTEGAAAAGVWGAELLSLTGERLASGSVNADASARAHLELSSRPGPRVYLLRLQGAGGETRLLPVVNK